MMNFLSRTEGDLEIQRCRPFGPSVERFVREAMMASSCNLQDEQRQPSDACRRQTFRCSFAAATAVAAESLVHPRVQVCEIRGERGRDACPLWRRHKARIAAVPSDFICVHVRCEMLCARSDVRRG